MAVTCLDLYFLWLKQGIFMQTSQQVTTIQYISPSWNTRLTQIFIYIWKFNTTVLKFDFRADNFLFSFERIWTHTIDTLQHQLLSLMSSTLYSKYMYIQWCFHATVTIVQISALNVPVIEDVSIYVQWNIKYTCLCYVLKHFMNSYKCLYLDIF